MVMFQLFGKRSLLLSCGACKSENLLK